VTNSDQIFATRLVIYLSALGSIVFGVYSLLGTGAAFIAFGLGIILAMRRD